MAKLIRRRSIAILAAIAILVAATGVVAAAPIVAPRVAGLLSGQPRPSAQPHGRTGPHTPTPPPMGVTETPPAPGSASVQLVAQDLTPASRLALVGAGFAGREHLEVTIVDSQGHPYAQVTLLAGDNGRLRETSVSLPPQLASGDYQVLVSGSTSHRTASVAFRMHDVPPTVALDAYTSKPGQSVGFAGSGFIPGETVHVYLGRASGQIVSAKATVGGAVSGRLKIPALPAGTYTLTLVGETSQSPASVGLNVQGFAPWVVLDRYALAPGERMGFIGQGFAPGEQVLVYLNSLHANPVLRMTADTAGQIIAQDTWAPSGADAHNVLTFVGQSSKATTTAEFTIQPAAQPTSPPTAP